MNENDLSADGQRAPGRPRKPHTDERILDAALRLMAQQGFVRMSMDTVAAEAGAILRPNGMSLLGTVLFGKHETPELLAAYRQYLVAPRRQRLTAILAAAQTRGELCEDADIGLAVNMLVGALYARYLAATAFAEDWGMRVVYAVLASLRHDTTSDANIHSLNHFKQEEQ